MPQPLRTKNHAQLAATLQISQFKSDTLQTMEYSLSTPSVFLSVRDSYFDKLFGMATIFEQI